MKVFANYLTYIVRPTNTNIYLTIDELLLSFYFLSQKMVEINLKNSILIF